MHSRKITYVISTRVGSTQAPPLLDIGKYAMSKPNTISLGQGAPFYYPPAWVFEELDFQKAAIHRYSPDPGLLDLREAISKKNDELYNISTPADDIVVTPGANQAFYNALLTATDPGDEILLISPYYFNHFMAATLLNLSVKQVALDPDSFELNIHEIRKTITDRTKVIVLVNPGNPTGKVFSKDELKQLGEIVSETDVLLFSDETYEYFTYNGTQHVNAAATIGSQVITFGSFSKTFGIPGWRLGYYTGPSEFMYASLKVQDTIGICAPQISQKLGLTLLKHSARLIPSFVTLMENNNNLASDLVAEIPWLEPRPASGAYYLFPRQSTGINTEKLAYRLIDEVGTYIVPGAGFGVSGGEHFRISFANVTEEVLKDAFSRLKLFKV